MAHRFYITGLPRSRTAWLARFFTFGDVYCLHDATIRKDWQHELAEIDRGAVGVSDSGLLLNRDGVEPGRWLIVKRDPAESLRSLLEMPVYPRAGLLDPMKAATVIGQAMSEMKWLPNERPCLEVDFDALDDRDTMMKAWDWLVGDVEPWCEWHWNEMRHMRVVVRPETYTEV